MRTCWLLLLGVTLLCSGACSNSANLGANNGRVLVVLDQRDLLDITTRTHTLIVRNSEISLEAVPPSELSSITKVSLERITVTPQLIQSLGRFSSLQKLELWQVRLAPSGVLAGLSRVATLSTVLLLEVEGLVHSDVSGLWRLNLGSLVIHGAHGITPEGFGRVRPNENLTELVLQDCNGVSPRDIGSIISNTPNIRTMSLASTSLSNHSEKEWSALPGLPTLTYLDLGFTGVGDETATWIMRCESIEYVDLSGSAVTLSALQRIITMPRIQEIAIRWSTVVGDSDFDVLAKENPHVRVSK